VRPQVTEAATKAAPQTATLSRDLSEFLIELSIGVHRYAMYPLGHPSLDPVVESIISRLAELLVDRRTLSIGVASKQLIIEGVATDQKHPVLSDLAKRLHEHQLGAISFEMGVTATTVSSVLAAIAEESERRGTPIGMRQGDAYPHWDHARVYRVGYEQLELKGASPGTGPGSGTLDRASALWLGLAQAALATDGPMPVAPDASIIARTIEGREKDSAYDQVIVGYMLQLAEELKGADDGESAKVRQRVSSLMNELDETTLQRLVQFGGNATQRKKFVLDANQSLAVDSVMKVVAAAATSSQQTISSSMTRLLSKLAVHAGSSTGAVRSQADTALRENVESLIDGWELKDPNPEAYTTVLDQMSIAASDMETEDTGEPLTGAERLVQMALEVDAFGPTVSKAVHDLVAAGGTGTLLRMLEEAPPECEASRTIKRHLTSPEEFRRLLGAGQVDMEALHRLVGEMGSTAVDPLLDVLADSDSRAVRRRVFDVLPGIGPVVAQRAIERLTDNRWFVLRNMLALLARLEDLPPGFDPQPFLDHSDHRVRREALPIAMRPGSHLRDRSLVTALSDDDERMVRMALLQIQDDVPEATVPTLAKRVITNEVRSDEIRTVAIRCLEHSTRPLARSVLLDLVTHGKTLFGKVKLAHTSPVVLEALRVLALKWANSLEAAEILEAAGKSKDPDVRLAICARPGAR